MRNKADLVFAQQVDAAAATDGRVQVEREVEPIGLRFGIVAVVIQRRAAAVLVELHQRSAVQRDRTAVCVRLYMAPAQIGFQQGCRNVSGVGVKTDVLCIQPVGRQRAVLRGELDAVCAEVILDEQVCGLRAGNVYLTERCAVPRDNEGDSAAVRPDVCCPFAVLGKRAGRNAVIAVQRKVRARAGYIQYLKIAALERQVDAGDMVERLLGQAVTFDGIPAVFIPAMR